MSSKKLIPTILSTSIALTATLAVIPSHAQEIRFLCTTDSNNIPTTYAQTNDGPMPVFKWTSRYFRPPYTPMQRCQEVAQRMNKFYSQGQLDFLTNGRVNRLPVICAGQRCDGNGSNVLITLKPSQNPKQVLQEIEANRQGAGGPSYQFSGGNQPSSISSGALIQNQNGTLSLDMKQYLGLSAESTISPKPPQAPPTSAPGIIRSTPSQQTPGNGIIPSNSSDLPSKPSRMW